MAVPNNPANPGRRIPKIRHHKPSKRACCDIGGRTFYLGPWPDPSQPPSEEVQRAHAQLIAAWVANNYRPFTPVPKKPQTPTLQDVQEQTAVLTVRSAVLRFLEHIRATYTDPETGKPTQQLDEYVYSLRAVVWLHGDLPAAEFGPKALKAVQQVMASGYDHPEHGPQRPLSRRTINWRVGRIKRAWKWLVSEELIPGSAFHALQAVSGLRQGRSAAKEKPPITAVDLAIVERTLPHLPPHIRGIIELMACTGMRPGEACRIRLSEIDRTGAIWLYRPSKHKTLHHGHQRVIALGPKAQAILKEFIRYTCPRCRETTARRSELPWKTELCDDCRRRVLSYDLGRGTRPWPNPESHDPDGPIFSPAWQREEHFARLRKRRKSRVQPSQKNRRKAAPKRLPGKWFTTNRIQVAVARACKEHGIPRWHPNQLRHTFATLVRREHGLEAAQVALGHAQANVTQVYAERDLTLALAVAARLG